MSTKWFMLCCSLLFLTACTTNNAHQDVLSEKEVCLSEYSYSSNHIIQFHLILSEGNIEMYDSIYDKLSDDGAADAMLPISIIMANKYNYSKACYDVYEILSSLYSLYCLPEDSIDSITYQLAMDYLERSLKTDGADVLVAADSNGSDVP